MSSKLFRGTLILSLGVYISKFLGLFYVIPFYDLIGGEDNAALYTYGYIPYTIFLTIATAGVPLAVSKYIAKYNALGEYAVGRKLFKSGLVIMSMTGVVAFLMMYVNAPWLAEVTLRSQEKVEGDISVGDVTTVIRAVSFALLIIPFMSLIRGFFQGHQSMGPSAVSQVIEQIVRIIFLLGGVYVVIYLLDGSYKTAISVATFAAFVGGIASLIVLGVYWKKRKPRFDELLEQHPGNMNISLPTIYKEIILYSIPFSLVALANPLFQLVDQISFNKAMIEIGLGAIKNDAFGVLNFSSHKLVIIPVSLATAFSMTLIPLITESFIKEDRQILYKQLDQTFQVLLFLTIPAALGISILAEPSYTMFYEYNELGTDVLRVYAPVAILFALFAVTAAILQGINEQKFTILSLLFGVLLKLVLNIPLIHMFETQGAVYATAIGYLAAIVINLFVIHIYADYSYSRVLPKMVRIVALNAVMAIIVWVFYFLLSIFLQPSSEREAIVLVLICGVVGASVYFYMSLKTRLADELFGSRVDKLRRRLRKVGV
ncbi:cell division protein [Bacillus coahuilensis m2-6]|uniref:putative polysaccharide biosynthesis protein n=1 Tax=Bacillus coahuilensis TaxID=408580 RepID=UPI0007504886|nr:polysaccharide biosynthesis protein [Bacillus coahuilensis]KUP06729.1 cell division protein [Bacillus coahuilensis m2-6]